MARGKRYSGEQKLNMKKVFAVIIAIAVIIMFIFVIKTLLSKNSGEKLVAETYFVVLEDNKYGVIDSKGNKIIEPSYAEYITIPNNKKPLFLCTYDVNYEEGSYHTKALNAKNEQILQEYEQIEVLQNVDSNNNVFYEENLLRVRKDGKWGLINLDGKTVSPCEYDEIQVLKGVAGDFVIGKEGKKGIVDSNGKTIIDPQYEEILPLGEDYKVGYIVKKEGNYGIINSSNKILVEVKYQEILPLASNNIFGVKEGDTWKVLKEEGQVVTEGKYDTIKEVQGSQIIVAKGGKYGVISAEGEEIIPLQYQNVDFAYTDTFIIKENGKNGLIKADKQILLEPKYASMTYRKVADFVEASEDGIQTDIVANDGTIKMTGILSEVNSSKGYFKIRIGENYKYYNFKFEEKKVQDILPNNNLFLTKQNGKYGYVDKDGNTVIGYEYDDATEQNAYGYAAIQKDGKWGCIDKNGKIVVEPSLELEDAIRIDFVGAWHLGQDINMNYYIK